MRFCFHPCVAAFLATLSVSTAALAQDENPNCPPGSWFCEDTQPKGAETPPELPPSSETPKAPEGSTTVVVPGAQATPPVIIYQQAPPPPPVVVVRRQARYVVAAPPPPAPAKKIRHRMWGFNLRLEGVAMDDRANETAGMGGIGFSLRLRPVRHFALDFGLDFVGGTDYQGFERTETPFTISAMVYANPRSKVQFYMLGGLGWSHARVGGDQDTADYDYFGGQLGPGLEIRLSPSVALNFDMLGFIRGRTDSASDSEPEFTDADTGRTTNTSGGGLFRGGVTFYW
jgi:hypothetical protein